MPVTAAEIVEPSAPAAPPSANDGLRQLCNFLRLPLLCGKAPCRRAGVCRGAPRDCLARRSPLVPEAARMYAAGLCALRNSGLDFEDEHWKLWEEEFAFKDWVKAVERACAPHGRTRQ